jgi:uncharacterized protein
MLLLALFCISSVTWFFSILAGGGSPFVLIPIVNLLFDATAVPPIITIGMFMGNAHRVGLFWQAIDWRLTRWFLPGAIAGAVLGSYTFTQLHAEWLQLLIGVFLVVSLLGFVFEGRFNRFEMKAWYIMPAGFLKALVSGLIGTTGPVLNPFYLSYGLERDQLIGTKATHMAILHSVKILTYALLGALSWQDMGAGLAIGLAAIPANILGKQILQNMDAHMFRKVVLGTMSVSGIWLIWSQHNLWLRFV